MEDNNLQNVQVSKNKNNNILFGILIATIIILSGYIAYDKFLSKSPIPQPAPTEQTNNNSQKEEPTEQTNDNSQEEAPAESTDNDDFQENSLAFLGSFDDVNEEFLNGGGEFIIKLILEPDGAFWYQVERESFQTYRGNYEILDTTIEFTNVKLYNAEDGCVTGCPESNFTYSITKSNNEIKSINAKEKSYSTKKEYTIVLEPTDLKNIN